MIELKIGLRLPERTELWKYISEYFPITSLKRSSTIFEYVTIVHYVCRNNDLKSTRVLGEKNKKSWLTFMLMTWSRKTNYERLEYQGGFSPIFIRNAIKHEILSRFNETAWMSFSLCPLFASFAHGCVWEVVKGCKAGRRIRQRGPSIRHGPVSSGISPRHNLFSPCFIIRRPTRVGGVRAVAMLPLYCLCLCPIIKGNFSQQFNHYSLFNFLFISYFFKVSLN